MKRRLALMLLLPVGLFAQLHDEQTERLAPYYPTPETIVERMLELGALKPGMTGTWPQRQRGERLAQRRS